MSITSYAQNFEDVLLWRALGHLPAGSYIDIGAQHPEIDSVSRGFYLNGWRGMNVEPMAQYAEMLRHERPDEILIQAAVSNHRGLIQFFEIPDSGLSTASATIAQAHRDDGYKVQEVIIPCVVLDDLLNANNGRNVGWMKIDVEGHEKEVLEGWKTASLRPSIVVVESTFPNSQRQNHDAWENLLLAKGYRFAIFDGLNRFYFHERFPELADVLGVQPNVFDYFEIAETNRALAPLRERHLQAIASAAFDRQHVHDALTAFEVQQGEFTVKLEGLSGSSEQVSREIDSCKVEADAWRNRFDANLVDLQIRLGSREAEIARLLESQHDHAAEVLQLRNEIKVNSATHIFDKQVTVAQNNRLQSELDRVDKSLGQLYESDSLHLQLITDHKKTQSALNHELQGALAVLQNGMASSASYLESLKEAASKQDSAVTTMNEKFIQEIQTLRLHFVQIQDDQAREFTGHLNDLRTELAANLNRMNTRLSHSQTEMNRVISEQHSLIEKNSQSALATVTQALAFGREHARALKRIVAALHGISVHPLLRLLRPIRDLADVQAPSHCAAVDSLPIPPATILASTSTSQGQPVD